MRTVFITLALLLASIAPAMEISTDKAQAIFCPSSTQIFKVTFSNTGTSDETVQLLLEGSAAKWATPSKEKLLVPASGKEQATIFVTAPPLIKPGTYELGIRAGGKTANIAFMVADCFKLELAVPGNMSVCPSDSYTLKGSIENNGKLMETIELRGSEFASIEPFAASIKPSQKEDFTISLQVPSGIAKGKHPIDISAESQTSYAKAAKQVQLEVLDCYNMAASMPAYAETCINEESTIRVNVTNKGVMPGVVTVDASRPEAKIDNSVFYLAEGESQVAEIRLASTSKGEANMTVTVDYDRGEIKKTITLINKDCHEFSVDLKPPSFICPCQSGFLEATINNLGKYADNFTISTSGMANESLEVFVDGQSKKTARLQIDVPCQKEGTFRLDVTTRNSKYRQEKTTAITAPKTQECYNTTIEITPSNVSVPKGKGGLFNVMIHNFGMLVTRYVLKATGANWSYVDPENITIGPNQTGEAYLYVSPVYGTKPGTYPIGLIASSERVYAGEMVDVIVKNETYMPEAANDTQATGFLIFGTKISTKSTGYALVGIGLLIVAFVLYLVIWDPVTREELNEAPETEQATAATSKETAKEAKAKKTQEKEPAQAKKENEWIENNAGDVKFLEVVLASGSEETEEEKIKIHNTKNTSIDVSGWMLSDGEGTYKIPQNTIIPTKGHWTVFSSTYNATKNAKGLKLADRHNYVVLLDKSGKIIDKYSW